MNKSRYHKINNSKDAHKLKKQLVMFSLALFTSISGIALINHNVNADTVKSTTNVANKQQTSTANVSRSNKATLHINNSLQDRGIGSNSILNNINNSNNSNNMSNIINKANNMHRNILIHAMNSNNSSVSKQIKPPHILLGVPSKASVPKPTIVQTGDWNGLNVNYWSNDVMQITGNGNLGNPDNIPVLPFDTNKMDWTLKIDKQDAKITYPSSGDDTKFSGNDGIYQHFSVMDLTGLDVSDVTDMEDMFANNPYLKTVDLSNWNISNVVNMENMFKNDISLRNIVLSNAPSTNVTNMSSMFENDLDLNHLNLNKLNTSDVSNMKYMFSNDINLSDLNLSNWNTNNVSDMKNMFANDFQLNSLKLGSDTRLDVYNQNWNIPFFKNNTDAQGKNSTKEIKNGTQPAGLYLRYYSDNNNNEISPMTSLVSKAEQKLSTEVSMANTVQTNSKNTSYKSSIQNLANAAKTGINYYNSYESKAQDYSNRANYYHSLANAENEINNSFSDSDITSAIDSKFANDTTLNNIYINEDSVANSNAMNYADQVFSNMNLANKDYSSMTNKPASSKASMNSHPASSNISSASSQSKPSNNNQFNNVSSYETLTVNIPTYINGIFNGVQPVSVTGNAGQVMLLNNTMAKYIPNYTESASGNIAFGSNMARVNGQFDYISNVQSTNSLTPTNTSLSSSPQSSMVPQVSTPSVTSKSTSTSSNLSMPSSIKSKYSHYKNSKSISRDGNDFNDYGNKHYNHSEYNSTVSHLLDNHINNKNYQTNSHALNTNTSISENNKSTNKNNENNRLPQTGESSNAKDVAAILLALSAVIGELKYRISKHKYID